MAPTSWETLVTFWARASNWAGVMDWAPSHRAWLGSLWTLDDESVGPDGGGGQGQGFDEPVEAGSVAGVHDHRQVGQPLEHRHGGDVQGVAGEGLVSADAPLAEDHLLVALGHDVLGAHQELFDGVGQTPL